MFENLIAMIAQLLRMLKNHSIIQLIWDRDIVAHLAQKLKICLSLLRRLQACINFYSFVHVWVGWWNSYLGSIHFKYEFVVWYSKPMGSQAWWPTTVNPAFGRREYLGYIVSSKRFGDPISKQNSTNQPSLKKKKRCWEGKHYKGK